jgi:hypothetical protein
LTGAKLNLLSAVPELYCSTPYDLARFVRGHIPTEHDVRSTRATLARIDEYSYPQKWLVKKYLDGVTYFGLSHSGVRYAQEELGIMSARVFEIKDIPHEHLITQCHIPLREFALANGYKLTWEQNVTDFKKLINPDAIAELSKDGQAYRFCIEPERQSFNENFMKKAKKYHSIFGKPEAEKIISSEKFRVIFVVQTERKRQTLLNHLAEEYPYRMFWVTTEDLIKTDIAGSIFLTPKDYQLSTYSFSAVS